DISSLFHSYPLCKSGFSSEFHSVKRIRPAELEAIFHVCTVCSKGAESARRIASLFLLGLATTLRWRLRKQYTLLPDLATGSGRSVQMTQGVQD
ncbi:hypothetical protein AB4Y67_08755, partial [Arthrobacter sp. YAF17]|uniref:hypothetical protein n=1 Tax=Arthrobacter sp. YAF17 TaxID=3233077 RepID=UPI003F8E5CB5